MRDDSLTTRKKPKEYLHLIEQTHFPFFNNIDTFSFLLVIATIVFCMSIPSISHVQIAHDLGVPIKPSITNPASQSSDKSELHGHGESEIHEIPFLVTKMGPVSIQKNSAGSISLRFSGISIVQMKSMDGEQPIPVDKMNATTMVAIKKPSMALDEPSYVWGDKVYISFIDPFSVKHPDKIETIGENHNIIISIGSSTKLDCIFRETGYGTGFFSGMITLKWPFVHDGISANGLTCIVVYDDKTVNQQKSSITVSYEYAPNEYAIATAPIEISRNQNLQ